MWRWDWPVWALALRLLTPDERAHWRSQSALLVAEILMLDLPDRGVRGGEVCVDARMAPGKRTRSRCCFRRFCGWC